MSQSNKYEPTDVKQKVNWKIYASVPALAFIFVVIVDFFNNYDIGHNIEGFLASNIIIFIFVFVVKNKYDRDVYQENFYRLEKNLQKRYKNFDKIDSAHPNKKSQTVLVRFYKSAIPQTVTLEQEFQNYTPTLLDERGAIPEDYGPYQSEA